jgi:hypothetical protein
VALDKCLEVAVPWADLQMQPDWSLRLIVLLSDGERFYECVPENGLIALGMP